MGLKAHDIFGFYGCSGCHAWYDTASKQEGFPNDERRAWFYRAMTKSLCIAMAEGVIK